MSDEAKRLCSKDCGRELGAANKSGVCSVCSKGYKPKARRTNDDGVLSRMGFSVKPADEAPPAPKGPRKARAPKSPPQRVQWRDQFAALARALGLDPEGMLERYCREWVEATRSRALNGPARALPAVIDGELAPRPEA